MTGRRSDLPSDATTITLSISDATALVIPPLQAAGVPRPDADLVAKCLVRADARGVNTHGIVLLPTYLKRIAKGLINPAPQLRVDAIAPAVAALDGQDGLGIVVATHAVKHAITLARTAGLGLVGVRNSTHYAMAATFLLQAIEAGFAAMVFTNASPALPPWGGRKEMFGTSPFAIGFPAPGNVPFILDMTPTVVARGKIRKAAREGRTIPEDWGLDANGAPTTDPNAVLSGGALLPIGGAKGAGLSMMLDIFCGVFTGARFGGDVGNQFTDMERPQGVGHFILVMRPDLFLTADDVYSRMSVLAKRVKTAAKAPGIDETFFPGEQSSRREAEAHASGVTYRMIDIAPVLEVVRAAGGNVPKSI